MAAWIAANDKVLAKAFDKKSGMGPKFRKRTGIMEILATVDVGSNAIRLLIAGVGDSGKTYVLHKAREPVRLGADVFASGHLSSDTKERALKAFTMFAELMRAHGVTRFRAVGTSALRELKESSEFLGLVKHKTGIKVEVIDGREEGQLVQTAVSSCIDLEQHSTLLIDIGGGSVELTVGSRGKILGTETFPLGTLRVLAESSKKGSSEKLRSFIDESLAPARKFLSETAKGLKLDLAVGTGGNFERLGKLRVDLLEKASSKSLTKSELKSICRKLESMTYDQRVKELGLKPDRADVIVPAALVTELLMEATDIDLLAIPGIGLREGIIASLLADPKAGTRINRNS